MSDLISRQAAIDKLDEYLEEYAGVDGEGLHSEKWCAMAEAKMVIKELPSAQSERKKGKWVADRYCSCCEWDKKDFDFYSGWVENYCPNCGADMRGE